MEAQEGGAYPNEGAGKSSLLSPVNQERGNSGSISKIEPSCLDKFVPVLPYSLGQMLFYW